MPFTTRIETPLDAARRAVEACNTSLLREASLTTLAGEAEPQCIPVALAASWAVCLDALLEKRLSAGGTRGRPDINPLRLAAVTGPAWAATLYSCSAGARREPVASPLLAALGATLLQPGYNLAQGVLTVLSLIAYSIGRTGRPEEVASLVWEDDGLASALFYETLRVYTPSYLYRLGYSGLPDATLSCASRDVLVSNTPLGEVFRVAGETSILYRDVLEGLPRALSLARHPALAFWEAIRIYADESGLTRRRCTSIPPDDVLALLEGCSPGDVLDLAVAASFLALLESLDSALLESQRYTVKRF